MRRLACTVVVGTAIGQGVPDLSAFSSTPQPVDTAYFGAPSVGNAWATALASTANVLAFNAFVLPPFSGGMALPIDSVSLSVNGLSIAPNATVWTPYAVERNGSATAGAVFVDVKSELRMVFESNVVLVRAEVRACVQAEVTVIRL
jgi:hypothetical protein